MAGTFSNTFSALGEGISEVNDGSAPLSLEMTQAYRWLEQRLAFFYSFGDNHIYNFEYEGTFIEELLDNRCILEMCQKDALRPDEGTNPHSFPEGAVNAVGLQADVADDASSTYSRRSGLVENTPRKQSVRDIRDKVTSVCGDMFKHIVYYPVFDVKDETKIVAVLEVGYKKRSNNPLMTQDMQSYIDQFRSHLDQFSVRLTSFCRGL